GRGVRDPRGRRGARRGTVPPGGRGERGAAARSGRAARGGGRDHGGDERGGDLGVAEQRDGAGLEGGTGRAGVAAGGAEVLTAPIQSPVMVHAPRCRSASSKPAAVARSTAPRSGSCARPAATSPSTAPSARKSPSSSSAKLRTSPRK